jgi:hypothetical protein
VELGRSARRQWPQHPSLDGETFLHARVEPLYDRLHERLVDGTVIEIVMPA